MGRDDLVTAGQMLDAIVQLRRVIGGRSRAIVVADEVSYLALLHLLQTIGEAANRTSPGFRAAHSDIPWAGIVAMRNHIVHGYDDVNESLVWRAANQGVERLLPMLEQIVPPDPESLIP
jgi:uncharacterized protein with HEPN domain